MDCCKPILAWRTGTIKCKLDLEAEDDYEEEAKILPCPFCEGDCRTIKNNYEQYVVVCDFCCYTSKDFSKEKVAISAHNRIALAVMKDGMKEAIDG